MADACSDISPGHSSLVSLCPGYELPSSSWMDQRHCLCASNSETADLLVGQTVTTHTESVIPENKVADLSGQVSLLLLLFYDKSNNNHNNNRYFIDLTREIAVLPITNTMKDRVNKSSAFKIQTKTRNFTG